MGIPGPETGDVMARRLYGFRQQAVTTAHMHACRSDIPERPFHALILDLTELEKALQIMDIPH